MTIENEARPGTGSDDFPWALAPGMQSMFLEQLPAAWGSGPMARLLAGVVAPSLKQRLPQARIFVSSIPDIYQLWKVLHTNRVARAVWATAHICPSMLGATRTEAERQQVVARQVAFNQILADTCHQYGTNCRWDGGATYDYKFSASQVSVLDFFHPDLDGQAALARVTWATSWWPTT
jgi:hypothetical protein